MSTATAPTPVKPAPRARKPKAPPADLAALARSASVLVKHASDPTRLRVILLLADGEKHVGALCQEVGQSQPAMSHHLTLMRHGGVVAPRRQGKNNFYG